MRNLIRCPSCQKEGKTRNLAEILPNGYIKIQRMHNSNPNGKMEYTILRGLDFILRCGECNNDVYIKERRNNEISDIREPWIHRLSLIQAISGFGSTSAAHFAGTIVSAQRLGSVL